MKARGLLVAALLLLVALPLLLAACSPVQNGPATPSPGDVVATATAPSDRSPAPVPAAGSPDAGPTTGARPVEEDEGLLAVLPESVGGTQIALEHQGFVDAADNPAFAGSIGSAVFFVAPGTSDIVSGLVAKPLEGVYSDAWYADWRETYDEGACAQAGGIGGHAEAQIGGRPVTITTCAGGMRVYHAWVKRQEVVVSLIALGEGRWGEQVMATLRP